jgi:transposase
VQDSGLLIKEAARTLGINYSTAKTILQLYKKTGRIDKIDQPAALAGANSKNNMIVHKNN